MKKQAFVREIIKFHEQYGRKNLPWRKTRDPYVILVSEILLRKTTARQVERIFDAFFSKYPNPHDLAQADENELKGLLKPLGMEHKRSKELIELAKALIKKHGGQVPQDSKNLLSLPGVGRYATGAVMCLAYGRDEAMVDTNAVRVITRYFGFKSRRKRPRDDPALWEFVKSLIPPGKCREFNLGLLDFASAVCRARKPECGKCPLKEYCTYYQKETKEKEVISSHSPQG